MVTVLVAEDETYARQSLVKQIAAYDKRGQFQILEAANGEQGYEIYREFEPELVLTDIRMPKMDGLELLKAVREKKRDTAVIMISAYSDFEYARTALTYGAADYLLKPVEDEKLAECLDKFLNINRTQKRETMISGQDVTTRYILSCVKEKNVSDFMGSNLFKKMFPVYRVFAVWINGSPCAGRLDQEKVLSGMEAQFGGKVWTGFRLVQIEGRLWAMVIKSEQNDSFLPRKLLKILNGTGYSVCIGVSSEHTNPEEIGSAFCEARGALEYKILTAEPIITCEQTEKWNRQSYCLPKNRENLLKEALEEQNARKAEYEIRQIMGAVRGLGKADRECLEFLLSQMIVILRGALRRAGAEEISLRESRTSILDFNSLEDMEEFLVKIGVNLCVLGRSEDGGRDIVDRMAEYAEAHYNQDITVKEMAEKVLFMNPDYVSHIFVEKKGVSFSNWLRQIRMSHARTLLEEGRFSVTEVASMSGYNDTSQFIRIFKQDTGITPKKYMDEKRSGKENNR